MSQQVDSLQPLTRGGAESPALPPAREPNESAARQSLVTLLREAGFDLRIDLGAAAARAAEWLVVLGVSAGSLALWLLAVRSVDLNAMTDIGLVSVLPAWSYLAFVPIAAEVTSRPLVSSS